MRVTLNDRHSMEVAQEEGRGLDFYPVDRDRFYKSLQRDIENHRDHIVQLSKIVSEVNKVFAVRAHHDHKAYGMLRRYMALLKSFDRLYGSAGRSEAQKADFSAHLAKLREEDGARLLGGNRAVVKLSELVRQSRHCGEPLFEMGCPPGHFMCAYHKDFRSRVVGAGLFDRLETDLTKNQVESFREFMSKNTSSASTFVFLDLDAFCPVCVELAARACHEEHIKLFVSDVGYSLDYKTPPRNWFEYVAFVVDAFATYRKVHPEAESAIGDMEFIFKIQEFGACVKQYVHLDAFLTYVTDAGYDASFRKPTGSWAGNDELYVILETRRERRRCRGRGQLQVDNASLLRALDSLSVALTHMCTYRRRALESFYVSQSRKNQYGGNGRERSPSGAGPSGE